MSGPDLPFPVPGSNAIGSFQIGVSPIGDITAFNPWLTVMSQYANSPRLTTLLLNFASYLDPTQNIDDFFDDIMNIDTAVGYGLDVWGRILAVNRVLKVGAAPRYFGFKEGLPDYDPFDTSPFYSGQALTQNFSLSDDGFRVLLLAKAFANICDNSIPAINTVLRTLFGSAGRCYCTDLGGMEMTYTFEFPLTPVQQSIIYQSGVLPKPTGVNVTVVAPV